MQPKQPQGPRQLVIPDGLESKGNPRAKGPESHATPPLVCILIHVGDYVLVLRYVSDDARMCITPTVRNYMTDYN